MKAEIRKLSDCYHLEIIAETDIEEILLYNFEEAIEEGFVPQAKTDLSINVSHTKPIRLMDKSSRGDNLRAMTVSMQTMTPDLTEIKVFYNAVTRKVNLPWYKKIFKGAK